MSNETEHAPVQPTVIDLDPDQVLEEGKATSPPGATPQSTTAPRRSTRPLPIAAAALVVGAVAGGWLYKDTLSAYFPTDHFKAISERVEIMSNGQDSLSSQFQSLDRLAAQLKGDVDALESSDSALANEGKSMALAVETLRQSVTSLETLLAETRLAVTDLAKRPMIAADGTAQQAAIPPDLIARLDGLEKDVAALKAQKSGAVDSATLSQSLADLKAKIEMGVSFADEYARLAHMVPAAAGLDVLAAHAGEGLPNAKGLAAELLAAKPGLPRPEAASPSASMNAGEKGWLDAVTDALSNVITIRDSETVDWQLTADKAIALAEAGDLPQAVVVIDETEAAAPASLQQWRDRAASRIALEAALASASASITRAIAAGQ